jgi:hypothetical protein
MRNRIVTKQLSQGSSADHQSSSKHGALTRVSHAFTSVIDWLRAGYPDEAPRTGHSPLLALNGPLALTPAHKDRIANDLEGQPVCTTNIEGGTVTSSDACIEETVP